MIVIIYRINLSSRGCVRCSYLGNLDDSTPQHDPKPKPF